MSQEPGGKASLDDAASPPKILNATLTTTLSELKKWRSEGLLDDNDLNEQNAEAFTLHNDGLKDRQAQTLLAYMAPRVHGSQG
jgi:hypothetical protein